MCKIQGGDRKKVGTVGYLRPSINIEKKGDGSRSNACKREKEEGSTLRPSNLTGVTCPGTMQSGPAASTMASVASPSPIGFGCCKFQILPSTKDKTLKPVMNE